MKQIKFITLLILSVFVTSCEDTFLSPDLTTGIDADSYYTTDEEIETAVLNIYDGIQGVNASENTSSGLNYGIQIEFYLTEMRSDNTRTKSQEGESAQFESSTVTANNGFVSNYYRSFYNVIYRANVVLENLAAASDANATKFEAEAKFLRAYAYFNLVRLYGDIPLIDQIIDPASDKITPYTRVPVADIYALITSDLLTAIDGLDNTYKNRASQAAAQALLAKVYLTQETPNYVDAQLLCESVMNSGTYRLIDNFNDIFYSEGNDEVIFAIGFVPATANDSQNFSAEWLNAVGRTSGVNYVTDEAVAALDALGGDRAALSYRVDVSQTTQFQVTKYLPNGEDGGPDGKTFVANAQTAGNDWIVLRYADVVLMQVEAIMAGNTSTTSSTAVNSFNTIRERANLPDDADSEITVTELLDERRVELAFENHRLFDLIRLGQAINVLTEYSAANEYGFTSTDLLLPIPQYEINLSNGIMTQNPGY